MVQNTNEDVNLTGLDDFIETPLHNCDGEMLQNGVNTVRSLLTNNPRAIMTIIASHPYIPASFLLHDLAEKMDKQNCIKELGLLFTGCPDDMIEACMWNTHDLARCIEALPDHTNGMIEKLLSKEHWIRRLLDADGNPAETLIETVKNYPDYKDKFDACYNEFYQTATFVYKK